MSFIRFIYVVFIILKFRLDEFFESRFIILIGYLAIRAFQSNKINRAIRLRRALENLGPIFVKFGQMLSTRRDLIPQDISDELSKLQDQVPPFSFNEVKKIIEKESINGAEYFNDEFISKYINENILDINPALK